MKKPEIAIFKKVCAVKGGIICHIAAAFDVTRGTVYNWCKDDADFKEALDDATEDFLDLAESQLRKLVQGIPEVTIDEHGNKVLAGWRERPSEAAVFFTLKTKGRKRGYSERFDMDVTSAGGSIAARKVDINVVYNKKEDLELQTKADAKAETDTNSNK